MKRFQRILVAVDLTSGDALVSDELVPPSQEAVNQAIWLAGHSGAELLFFYVLDISDPSSPGIVGSIIQMNRTLSAGPGSTERNTLHPSAIR